MKKIPAPSKKRLLTIASILSQKKKTKITSVELSELTGWTDATIRRDISLLELHTGVSNGYNTEELKDFIQSALSINLQNKKNCCIVGLTKLGEALLENSIFDNSPFKIVAGFDTNMNRIELMKSNLPLYPTVDLEEKIHSLKIEYAILTVTDDRAQNIADRLVNYGIKGIVNYTNTILTLPAFIKVENANPAFALALISSEQ